jgi:hypothetical protein
MDLEQSFLKIIRDHGELMGEAFDHSPAESVTYEPVRFSLNPIKLPVIPEIARYLLGASFEDPIDIGGKVCRLFSTHNLWRKELAERLARIRSPLLFIKLVDRNKKGPTLVASADLGLISRQFIRADVADSTGAGSSRVAKGTHSPLNRLSVDPFKDNPVVATRVPPVHQADRPANHLTGLAPGRPVGRKCLPYIGCCWMNNLVLPLDSVSLQEEPFRE